MKQMKNALLIFPLLAFEWEKGKGKCVTIGWLNKTYYLIWGNKKGGDK